MKRTHANTCTLSAYTRKPLTDDVKVEKADFNKVRSYHWDKAGEGKTESVDVSVAEFGDLSEKSSDESTYELGDSESYGETCCKTTIVDGAQKIGLQVE